MQASKTMTHMCVFFVNVTLRRSAEPKQNIRVYSLQLKKQHVWFKYS